jgi:ribosomal protein S27AE
MANNSAHLESQRKERMLRHSKRKIVYYAIKTGKLVRPNKCSSCGKECRPEAHHQDYKKPLMVVWLCIKCHRSVDRIKRLNYEHTI